MGTLNFEQIPKYTAENVARYTLLAVRRHLAQKTIEGGENNENRNNVKRPCLGNSPAEE